jgi:peptidoglycan pentaglycine glycine transferase (the first glycine)
MSRVLRSMRIEYVALRPPRDCGLLNELGAYGFRASMIPGNQRASLVLDLSQGTEALLAQMSRTTRYNIRLAEEKGVTVREGNESDISTCYQLMKATSQRHSFRLEPENYIMNLWKLLERYKHVKLFIAEYDHQDLSVLLTIPFGSTVVAKRFGWNGQKRWVHVNEFLFWKAMLWSKENGFHDFDLDGIQASAANATLEGKRLDKSLLSTSTRFKLGFGGSIVLLPPTYERVPNLVLRWLWKKTSSYCWADRLSNVRRRIIHGHV